MTSHDKKSNVTNVRWGSSKDVEIARKMWKELFTDNDNEIEYYFSDRFDAKDFLVVEDDLSKIVSSCHAKPYDVMINNICSHSRYLVAIGTPLEERGNGYMDTLLRACMSDSKKKGQKIIFLSPIDSNIYRKYGFAYASDLEKYHTYTYMLPHDKIEDHVKMIPLEKSDDDEKYEEMAIVYDQKIKDKNFYLVRNKAYYRRHLRELQSENGRTYLIYSHDIIKGYVTFYLKDDLISVREIMVLDNSLYQAVFSLLHGFKNYYHNVEFVMPSGSYLNFRIKDQMQMTCTEFPFIMVRCLDPLSLLKDMSIKGEDIAIFLKDDILDTNTGIYKISSDGDVMFTDIKEERGDIILDMRAFTQLIFGYFDINELMDLGMVDTNNMDIVNRLMKIFPKKRSYIQEYE